LSEAPLAGQAGGKYSFNIETPNPNQKLKYQHSKPITPCNPRGGAVLNEDEWK